jgi:hypothetical protein
LTGQKVSNDPAQARDSKPEPLGAGRGRCSK